MTLLTREVCGVRIYRGSLGFYKKNFGDCPGAIRRYLSCDREGEKVRARVGHRG